MKHDSDLPSGTGFKRHPWFGQLHHEFAALLASLHQRYGTALRSKTTTTRNYGILGGWLICEFWTVKGEPTGLTRSELRTEL